MSSRAILGAVLTVVFVGLTGLSWAVVYSMGWADGYCDYDHLDYQAGYQREESDCHRYDHNFRGKLIGIGYGVYASMHHIRGGPANP